LGNGYTGGSPPFDLTDYYPNNVVTVLGKNTLTKTNHVFLGWSTNPNAASAQYVPGDPLTMYSSNIALYAVWSYTGSGGTDTIEVPFDGRHAGDGSKQSTERFVVGSPDIVQVLPNLPNHTSSGAVVENLVIDGLDPVYGATGLLLQDVCNCLVRNLTIKNCAVGIRVKLTSNNSWSHGNRFEHIRMENVKIGILFEGTETTKDYSHTIIDDVGIKLKNDSNSNVGIKLESTAKIYNAFIKANVWLNGSNGKGLEINGQLKLSLINLAVQENTTSNTGKCIVLNSNADISVNQSFLLTVINVANTIANNGGTYSGIRIVS
jgi:hypothetical protein